MIDWILLAIAMAAGGGAGHPPGAGDGAQEVAFVAEPQQPSGQFTTATEVRPILLATRANWVAVREYDGRDLVYVTHLLSWRCGLHRLRLSVNDGPLQDWPLPPCLTGTAQPNALRAEDGLPYIDFPPGHVQSVTVDILYDDLGTDSARFERARVLMP